MLTLRQTFEKKYRSLYSYFINFFEILYTYSRVRETEGVMHYWCFGDCMLRWCNCFYCLLFLSQLCSRFPIFPSTILAQSHKFWCGLLSLLLNSKCCAVFLASWYVTQNSVANRNHFQMAFINNWNNTIALAPQVYWI